MARFLLRFDDVCPQMDWNKFIRVIEILSKYKVTALLAVIPENRDQNFSYGEVQPEEYKKLLHSLKNAGWEICQHGHTHEYRPAAGGELRINNYGEFPNLSLIEQEQKIKAGKEILEKMNFRIRCFIAPAHAFDNNTLEALAKNNINIVSDGLGFYSYLKNGILMVPQMLWRPSRLPLPGIATICLHSNTFTEEDFATLEEFIKNKKDKVVTLDYVINQYKSEDVMKKVIYHLVNKVAAIIWRIAPFFKKAHGLHRPKQIRKTTNY